MSNQSTADWPGSRRVPNHHWLQFMDGNIWEFHEGTDFPPGQAKAYRSRIAAYVNNYNARSGVDGGVLKVRTTIKPADDGHMIIYIQSFKPDAPQSQPTEPTPAP